MTPTDFYFSEIAVAFVRGRLPDRDDPLFHRPLTELSATEFERVIQIGLDSGLRLHRFKCTMELPRVQRVLGILRGIRPATLLDIGSGRGAFLWPCLQAFPNLSIVAIDPDEKRIADINAVQKGGIQQVWGQTMEVTHLEFPDKSFDTITFLEVLEHLPNPQQAIAEVVRVAQRFVVLSVPAYADDNPEHLYQFSQATITQFFEEAGAVRVRFESVFNHIIAVAKVKE